MKKKTLSAVLMVLACLLCLHVRATESLAQAAAFAPYGGIWEDEALSLDGLRLKLGLLKAEVISQLEVNYRLQKTDSTLEDAWDILSKPEGSLVGQMRFKDGRLRYISKHLGLFQVHDLTKAFPTLYAVLAEVNKERQKSALISTRTVQQADTTMENINLIFGKKKISIFIKEKGPGAPAVDFQEILE
jgi:hypothetical protein